MQKLFYSKVSIYFQKSTKTWIVQKVNFYLDGKGHLSERTQALKGYKRKHNALNFITNAIEA